MEDFATLPGLLPGGPRQFGRLLQLHTPLGPDTLVAEQLAGVEALAPSPEGTCGFRLDLTALSVDAHLDLASLLGQPVLLELKTANALDARPLHGHVTAFERLGSNGGLARYRLLVEPWLALLRDRVDSYVFQDMSVVEIVESVLDDYTPDSGIDPGRLAPKWRWDLADPAAYRKRSLTTQYEESDLAFVERLLADEGLFYWFEHDGDVGGDSLGAHTMVIADHNDAFADLGAVRYHRSDATERDDSIQQFAATRRWQTGRLQRASWDYRRLDTRATEVDADNPASVIAVDADTAGPYAWPDRATGERFARQQLEALQVERNIASGVGTWRQLQPGGRFVLSQHPAFGVDAEGEPTNRFHCLRLHHRARNNLGAEILAQVEQQLGLANLPPLALPAALGPLSHPTGEGDGDKRHSPADASLQSTTDFYQNTFTALPAAVPYRARTTDGHGLRLHPKPRVHGTQTAIVVTDGTPLQTDRDHRIKVQFPWQRGSNASHRQSHPAGDDNAPATAAAWTWVRVAAAWAGDNWGSVLLPRKGQEVVVAFLEGDIDRPVVVGSVHNGRGQPDAPHNQASGGAAGATGNAPAWFDGNGHDAVFTGFKSQALSASQSGSGGYQQLRLDDTPGQGRAQASTTQHASTLTLGHLKGGKDNVRDGERGFGVELSSAASGAIRAGAGLLLSTERGRAQLDADGARAQLDIGRQLLANLAEVAKAQGADLPREAAPLPADEGRRNLGEHLAATASSGSAGQGIGGGNGDAPGWAQSAGVAGIALHAAQGTVSARAATGTAELAAQVSVTIASTTADVQIAAPNKHLLATAAGAYIKLEGDNIALGAPGTIDFKAAKKEWGGAQSATSQAPQLSKGKLKLCEFKARGADSAGDGAVPLGG